MNIDRAITIAKDLVLFIGGLSGIAYIATARIHSYDRRSWVNTLSLNSAWLQYKVTVIIISITASTGGIIEFILSVR